MEKSDRGIEQHEHADHTRLDIFTEIDLQRHRRLEQAGHRRKELPQHETQPSALGIGCCICPEFAPLYLGLRRREALRMLEGRFSLEH